MLLSLGIILPVLFQRYHLLPYRSCSSPALTASSREKKLIDPIHLFPASAIAEWDISSKAPLKEKQKEEGMHSAFLKYLPREIGHWYFEKALLLL